MELPNPPPRRWLIDNMMRGYAPPPVTDPNRAKYFAIIEANMAKMDRAWCSAVCFMSPPWPDLDHSIEGALARERQVKTGVEL